MGSEHDRGESGVADRLVVSYRAAGTDPAAGSGFDESDAVHRRIQDRPFSVYLRRVHGGPVTRGDEWSEFVSCGCGSTTDVTLRVEAVEGGTRFDEDTEVELVSLDEVGAESPPPAGE